MKILAAAVCVGAVAAWTPQASQPHVLIVSGDADGYLTPCGCTKPMSGGIRRRVDAAKALSARGRTTLVDNGSLAGGLGRQEEMKAETAAEILSASGWAAINLSPSDARLGRGAVESIQRLSKGRLVTSALSQSEGLQFPAAILDGPFAILGAAESSEAIAEPLARTASPVVATVRAAAEEALSSGLAPILLFHGGLDAARRLAAEVPTLKLIVYRSGGEPTEEPEKVGDVWLASPGADGKHILRLEYLKGSFRALRAVELTPEYRDDPLAARLFRHYLARLKDERLLDRVPREPSAPFAGSKVCGSCHGNATKVWRASEHAHALATLEIEGHDVDPECIPCHVVALDKERGFRSRAKTPLLTDVGCESCHGPARDHARSPKKVRMPAVGAASCMPCHTTSNSPGFDFDAYWKRIAHR